MSDCRSTVFLPESGCSDCSAFESRLNNLETRIINLSLQISALQTSVNNQISALQTNVDMQISALRTSMNIEIATLNDTDARLDNMIEAIDSRLRIVEDAIESLIGGTKIPISITDSNGQSVSVNVFGEVSS